MSPRGPDGGACKEDMLRKRNRICRSSEAGTGLSGTEIRKYKGWGGSSVVKNTDCAFRWT